MSAPSPSPPRRPPLGPFSNRRGELTTSKPAPGKENIRPRHSITVGVRATATTTRAAIRSPPQALPSTISATATAVTTAYSSDIAADTDPAAEAPEPASQPSTLPPWRLPGAFDTDESDEEEEKAITGTGTKTIDEANASLITDNDNDNIRGAENPIVEKIATAASLAGDIASPPPVSDDAVAANESEHEVTIDFVVLGMTPRELNSVAVDLDADHELDYGDEFHDLPQ